MPKGNTAKLDTLTYNLKTATLYLALYETTPDNNDTGVEASYVGYARQEIVFGTPIINGNAGEVSNTNDIEFPIVPSSAGNISYAAIRKTLTGGDATTLVYYGSLGATYQLTQGVKPTVPAGNLTVYEN